MSPLSRAVVMVFVIAGQSLLAVMTLVSGCVTREVPVLLSVVVIAWGVLAGGAAIGLAKQKPTAWWLSIAAHGVLLLAIVGAFAYGVFSTPDWRSKSWDDLTDSDPIALLVLWPSVPLLLIVGLLWTRPRITEA